MFVQMISFEKEIPSWGSRAGNISQASRPTVARVLRQTGCVPAVLAHDSHKAAFDRAFGQRLEIQF